MYMYAAGRRLAHKWNTELKLDIPAISGVRTYYPYALDYFNITATIATPEEIKKVKSLPDALKDENASQKFMPEVLDYPDNVYLQGYWIKQEYFEDIADIIREEFTLKQIRPEVKLWENKILSAECSVSMHFRHGDFLYHPQRGSQVWRGVPIDYYEDCLAYLKKHYENLSVFVFSDNPQWVAENLRLDVPTEIVSGRGLLNAAELYLMSLCKHNILQGGSTFSEWGAWLNKNPDKKIFMSAPSNAERVSQYRKSLTPSKRSFHIGEILVVPFDVNKRPDITQPPIFSLLLVVNNDAATIADTLDSLLNQDHKYYAMDVIGSKWKLPLIWYLHEKENTRYNELKRRIPGITNIMLTKSLREMEADGLILRRELISEPPKVVEYSLTDFGKELIPALNELYAWGQKILQNES